MIYVLEQNQCLLQKRSKKQREETEHHAHEMSAMMASMWSRLDTQYSMFAFGMPTGMPSIY